MNQEKIAPNAVALPLGGGTRKSFAEFTQGSELRSVSLSPEFEKAVKGFGKVTLMVFADMDCPDCRAVVPFLGRIESANPGISLVFGEWNHEVEKFLQGRLGTGRVPTVLAMDESGKLMDGAFIERPLEVHRAAAEAASRKESMITIGKFRNGGCDAMIENDLLKVLRGEKSDVLRYIR